MLTVTPLGEQGVYLVDEDHCWLVAAGNRKQSSDHLLTLTNLRYNMVHACQAMSQQQGALSQESDIHMAYH